MHRPEQPRQLLVGRLALVGADEPDGDDRRTGAHREAGDAGVPAMRVAVARARALRVDAEDAAALEHVGGRGERALARAPALAPDRDLADGAEEPRRLRVVEVLGLGDERHPPPHDQREEDRVEERPVVRGEDHRAPPRQVLTPFDAHPVQRPGGPA